MKRLCKKEFASHIFHSPALTDSAISSFYWAALLPFTADDIDVASYYYCLYKTIKMQNLCIYMENVSEYA